MAWILAESDSGGSGGGGASAAATQLNGGRLCVMPYHAQIDSVQQITLDATTDRLSVSWLQKHCRTEQSLSLHVYDSDGTANIINELYEADSDGEPTGDALATLGNIGVTNSVSDEWKRLVFGAEYAFLPGKRYVNIMRLDTGGVTVNLSSRQKNTNVGSQPMDTLICKQSSDSGSTWATYQQSSEFDATQNFVLGSQANHAPPLCFCRHTGSQIYIPVPGLVEIPYGGISLDCSAFTADTLTYIYGYLNESTGILDMENSSTFWTIDSETGIKIKDGDSSRRYLGMIYPKNLIGSVQSPLDVMDSRCVFNAENKLPVSVGKVCPYYGTTSEALSGSEDWEGFNGGNDYRFEFIADHETVIHLSMQGAVGSPAGIIRMAFGVDAADTVYNQNNGGGLVYQANASDAHQMNGYLRDLSTGHHYSTPIRKPAASVNLYYKNADYSDTDVTGILYC